MTPLRFLLPATVLATLSLAFAGTALADVEISRSGNTVTVEGSTLADELHLTGTGSSFSIVSANAQRIDAGAGCSSSGLFSGSCGSGVTTVSADLRGGDDDIRDGSGAGEDHTYTLNIDGGDGEDTIGPVDSVGTWDGGAENDTLQGGEQNQTLVGGDDNDELLGGKGNDSLNGNGGNDTLNGEQDADVMHGGSGDDTLNGAGGETLDGGSGGDAFGGSGAIVTYADRSAAVTVTAGSGSGNDGNADDGAAGSRDTVGAGIEVFGSDFGDNLSAATGETLHGGDGNDTLASGTSGSELFGDGDDDDVNAGSGNDSIDGGAGNDDIDGGGATDVLRGGEGGDVLKGGAGSDTASYDDRTDAVTVTLDALANDGNALDGPVATRDRVEGASVEIVSGGSAADTLTGDGGSNELRGNAGADILNGAGGADKLTAGVDGATMDGGPGADQFVGGGDTHDVVTYAARTAGVVVNLVDGVDGNEGEPAENDSLFSVDQVNGGAGDDQLTLTGATIFTTTRGNGGADALGGAANQFGGEGNDTLSGRPNGISALSGENGDDTFNLATGRGEGVSGGAGFDVASYAAATQPVSADLLTGLGGPPGEVDSIQPDVEGLIGSAFGDNLKGGSSDSSLEGGAGDDSLLGRGGRDGLNGGEGDDVIEGGAGRDGLNGGAGADTLQALDSEADKLNCGDGVDTTNADPIDALDASCNDTPAPPPPAGGGTTTDPPAPPGTAPTGPTGPDTPRTGPPTLAAPVVSGFSASPKRFTAKGKRAGTSFRFSTDRAGSARIRIERLDAGRLAGKRCVKPTKRNARAKPCDRPVLAGTLTARIPKGAAKVAFSGAFSRKAVKAGRYRATLTVTDAGRTSKPVTVAFTVVK